MTNFFPDPNYKLPTTSNYLKFQEGENTIRVLSSAIVGYEYWTGDNKPVRSREAPETIPADIKIEKDGTYRINHFWAFVVYNYEANKIQILEITQKGIMKTIEGLVKNPKWGNPFDYDITITRTGSGFDTEYGVVPNPKEELDTAVAMQYERLNINLEALFYSGDPFMSVK